MSEETATRLKEEGNALFIQSKFDEALVKYTAAIELDGSNAILWANRSACHLSMKRHLDAVGDSRKATELDPMYHKAWARLATANDALKEYLPSSLAWQCALNALPTENLTLTQKQQRQEYQKRLYESTGRLHHKASGGDRSADTRYYGDGDGQQPWEVAREMIPALEVSGNTSSSPWVLHGAYKEFAEGGEENGFQHLVNGLIREDRVFHMEKEAPWISAYNRLRTFEHARHDPWLAAGPDCLKREAPSRLAEKGWDVVRPDIDLTIRFWVLRGKIEGALDGNVVSQNEYYGRCLEVVEWRRELWKDVPASVRSEVFDEFFIRGLRNLYLQSILQYHDLNRQGTKLAEKLAAEANIPLKSLETDPAPGDDADPGFKLSFYDYCRGSAYACKAFFYSDLAKRGSSAEQNFQLAGEYYLQAADAYPVDSEHHYYYLNSALQHLYHRTGVTARRALDILAQFRESVKESKKI
ncbi:hypothetical protein IW261DRAFT_1608046 [Armillaria novae-zelandiae]|uniref:TPR-like protein n=1 Tax=Armillaria novae-zelandiae TaxID=153914 RepID=A0AA39P974_9AGAR|nr:hypothetical protein IW261DRAFT_1608046 [Armillaria novae-zelandiae]